MEDGWQAAAAGFLALCSIWDVRWRRLPVWLLILGLAGGLAVGFLRAGPGLAFAGLIPGAVLRLLAAVCPGKIGEGDGWTVMAVGAMGGWINGLFILEMGLILMAPLVFYYGAVRKQRKKELPLSPFLLGGCLFRILF